MQKWTSTTLPARLVRRQRRRVEPLSPTTDGGQLPRLARARRLRQDSSAKKVERAQMRRSDRHGRPPDKTSPVPVQWFAHVIRLPDDGCPRMQQGCGRHDSVTYRPSRRQHAFDVSLRDVGRGSAVRRRIRQGIDQLHLLDDGTGPAVRDDDGQPRRARRRSACAWPSAHRLATSSG